MEKIKVKMDPGNSNPLPTMGRQKGCLLEEDEEGKPWNRIPRPPLEVGDEGGEEYLPWSLKVEPLSLDS